MLDPQSTLSASVEMEPHSTLSLTSEMLPHSTDSPLVLLPHRTELPHNTEEPHKTELPPRIEEPFTRTTLPLVLTAAEGEKALPAVGGARSVFDNAAFMSR